MKLFNRMGSAATACVIVALTACNSGGPSPLTAFAGATPAQRVLQLGYVLPLTRLGGGGLVRPRRDRSWILPGAKKGPLAYISSYSYSTIWIYSWPKGKKVGEIAAPVVDEPQGMCVDGSGNVFVANTGAHNILEFARGALKPIQTLDDAGAYPTGCSVDPTTGNLAVTNLCTAPSCGSGNVYVYEKATGTPKMYVDDPMFAYFFCGFDDKGNLFVDGLSNSSEAFHFAELPHGRKHFIDIALKELANFNSPAGVQWDGKYIAVGVQTTAPAPSIYQYSISGSQATLVGDTVLKEANYVDQFWLLSQSKSRVATDVVAPNSGIGGYGNYSGIAGFYDYPAGGTAFKTIADVPIGSVVTPSTNW